MAGVDKREPVPDDVKAEWEKKLQAEGLGAELEIGADAKKALEALGLNPEIIRALRLEILGYLATREDYYGSHNRTINELAGRFSLQDQKLVIQQEIEDSQELMAEVQRTMADAIRQDKPERAVIRETLESFPDVPADIVGILYDRRESDRARGFRNKG